MKLVLNGSELTDLDAVHALIADHEGVPEWYGRNLDALWDVLTGEPDGWEIELRGPAAAMQNLGADWTRFLGVLVEAVEESRGRLVIVASPPSGGIE